ncbi:FAD-binding protein, partial [Acinetobacter baumannii]
GTAFQEALRAMRSVVGARYVFADETGLLGYHDHFAMKPIEAHMPSAAVAPRTVEEIQALLKIARDHSVPVWTISTGRNLGY